MTKILDEVLAANVKYAENLGTKANCYCLRAAISRFSPVWIARLDPAKYAGLIIFGL
jgi:hypothetical protein